MQIFIRGATVDDRKVLVLEVNPTTLIKEVKDMISEKTNIPLSAFGLVFGGCILSNDYSTLSENRIGMESTLFIYSRSYGD